MKRLISNNAEELFENIKISKQDNDLTEIIIQNDIILKKTIILNGIENLRIISYNNSKLIGGTENPELEREGKFITVRTDIEPRFLMVNGEFRERSCFPRDKKIHLLDKCEFKWTNSRNGGWDKQPALYKLTHLTVDEKDIPKELDIENADICLMHIWDESTVSIENINNGIITTKNPIAHPPGAFGRDDYYILNTKYALQEGNWCYDRKNKKIYYYTYSNENNINISFPYINSVIKVENCINIEIKNISILLANAECGQIAGLRAINPLGAIDVKSCENVKLNSITVSKSGGNGIKFIQSRNIKVFGCKIDSCLSGGIVTYECENEMIQNNKIENIGLYDFSAIPIHAGGKSLLPFVLDGSKEEKGKTEIIGNYIKNAPYCGITCSGGPHLIKDNIVLSCMEKLNDGAGIYCSRANGTIIENNLISDINKYNASGIYLDELSENCQILANLIINVEKAFHNHIAKENFVKNNFVRNNGDTLISMGLSVNYKWENNIIFSKGKIEFKCYSDYNGGEYDILQCISFCNDIIYSENGVIIFNKKPADIQKYKIINIKPEEP